jgi:broad specificity phosphatase PhoE
MRAPGAVGTLFLVRHGRTAENQNRYVGWGDPPLDAVGAAQAAQLLDILDGEQIDAIYASPLQRALDTARPLARARQLEIRVRPQLAEIHYGDYQGVSKETRKLRLRREHRYERLPHGESLFDLYRRVEEFGAELASALREGHRAVVVSHYWSNQMLIGCLRGMEFDAIVDATSYRPDNGSVLEVSFQAAAGSVSVSGEELRCGEGALP